MTYRWRWCIGATLSTLLCACELLDEQWQSKAAYGEAGATRCLSECRIDEALTDAGRPDDEQVQVLADQAQVREESELRARRSLVAAEVLSGFRVAVNESTDERYCLSETPNCTNAGR